MTAWPRDGHCECITFGRLRRGALIARVRSFGNATTER